MPDVFIDSFGARWQDPPPPRYRAAVLGINLTNALLNPPDDPALADIVARQTGQDAGVRDYILNTPGAARIVNDAVHELTVLRSVAQRRPVQLLVNCWYWLCSLHRSARSPCSHADSGSAPIRRSGRAGRTATHP
ncbi:hypothetical protein [Streptomyces sp. SID685]|uniref:hypothetical protein n=1 Tax=Streptomyces sp. SID685 TaxID=2690322 RepID=UPI001F1FE599|nr:hypothetical protein [Streptomyces sp. SID685]